MSYSLYCRAMLIALVMMAGLSSVQAHIIPGSTLKLQVHDKVLVGSWDLSIFSLAQTAHWPVDDLQALRQKALDHLSVKGNGVACSLHIDKSTRHFKHDRERQKAATPQFIALRGNCPQGTDRLTIDYFSLLLIDPRFQGFINIKDDEHVHTSALSQHKPAVSFKLHSRKLASLSPDLWAQFVDFLRLGIWHIWLGYDHMLFLVSLLLTSALTLKAGQWQARHGFRQSFVQVAKIVTSFTLAHSLTLALVIFNIISLPSRLVESCIALSIMLAAGNNLYPLISQRLWLLTFSFGLIHGMGFASALREVGLPDAARLQALVGFNLGVETGQMAVVALLLPLIYAFRNSELYAHKILPLLSVLIFLVASYWFVVRAFAL